MSTMAIAASHAIGTPPRTVVPMRSTAKVARRDRGERGEVTVAAIAMKRWRLDVSSRNSGDRSIRAQSISPVPSGDPAGTGRRRFRCRGTSPLPRDVCSLTSPRLRPGNATPRGVRRARRRPGAGRDERASARAGATSCTPTGAPPGCRVAPGTARAGTPSSVHARQKSGSPVTPSSRAGGSPLTAGTSRSSPGSRCPASSARHSAPSATRVLGVGARSIVWPRSSRRAGRR